MSSPSGLKGVWLRFGRADRGADRATASDPAYVLAEASFLLNLNRLNVALSRPRQKLVVVASRAVIDLLTSDLDIWDSAIIWKRLYYQYAPDVLWQGTREQRAGSHPRATRVRQA